MFDAKTATWIFVLVALTGFWYFVVSVVLEIMK